MRYLPWQGRQVEIHLQARRFRCRNKEWVRKIFAERLPAVAAHKRRETTRLSQLCLQSDDLSFSSLPLTAIKLQLLKVLGQLRDEPGKVICLDPTISILSESLTVLRNITDISMKMRCVLHRMRLRLLGADRLGCRQSPTEPTTVILTLYFSFGSFT
jgi:hypothetical protein